MSFCEFSKGCVRAFLPNSKEARILPPGKEGQLLMLGGCGAVKEKLPPEDRQTFLSKHLKEQESGKPQVPCRLKKKKMKC